MNGWIVAILMGLLLIGIIGAGVVFANESKATSLPKCGSSSCTGSCTAENNCGSSSCRASNGGTCACGKTSNCNGSCSSGNTCSLGTCGAKTGSSGTSCGCSKS